MPSPGSSWSPLSDRSVRHGLIGVLGLAIALRVWGLPYGLPYFVHPDEGIVVPLAMRFLTGDPNPHFFNWPTLYMYVLAGAFAAYGLVLQATEGISAIAAFVRDPSGFYLLARAVAAVLGAATVGLTYLAGARLGDRAIGLAAAFFLAVNLQHVVDSHFATTDIPVTFLIVAALLVTLRYWERGRVRDAFLCGLLGGLAAAAKYNGGLVGSAFVVAHLLRAGDAGRSWWGALRSAALPVWVGGAALGFLLGTPFAALAPREFTRGLFAEIQAISTVQLGNEGDLPGLLFHLLHSLPQAMGVALLLCAGLGLVVALRRHGPQDWLLLAFPVPYLVIIGTWASRFERYAVPLLPFASVLAALGLATVSRRWLARLAPARQGLVFAAAALLVAAPVFTRVLYYELLLTRPDSRQLAGVWIERHVDPGSRVAIEPYSLPIAGSVVDQVRGLHRATSPQVNIPARIRRAQPETPPTGGIRVYALGAFEFEYDLDVLRAHRIDYVVLSSFMYKRFTDSCATFPAACRFYRDLERGATLVFEVRPIAEDRPLWVGDIYAPASQVFARERPGPIIKIYRLTDAR